MKQTLFFSLALTAAVLLRLCFVSVLPLGNCVRLHLEGLNDEPSHYNYVKYLFKHRRFPVQTRTYRESGSLVRNDFEYYHPPLYYLLCVPAYALAGPHAGLYCCRMLSFACGIGSLWLISLLFRKMGCSAQTRRGAVLLCGVFPCLAYFSSLTSNDAMSWLIALWATYACMSSAASRDRPPDFSWKKTIGIGLLLGLGTLVKSSLLLLFPIAAACLLYAWYKRKNHILLLRLLVMLGLAVAINLPWFIRNIKLYHSITALEYANGPAVSYPHLLTLQGFIIFFKASVRFFWFPMQHIPASPGQKILSAVGAVILCAMAVLAGRYIVTTFRKRASLYNHAILIGLLVLNLAAYVQYNLVWGNREGRFLMPSLASLAFFAIVPLHDFLTAAGLRTLFLPASLALGLWGYSYLLLTL